MKIIHTGDVHLGSALSGLTAEKAALRQTELLDGFARLCAYAREQQITAVLIAGDLFDGNVPSSLCQETFACIERAKPVYFFYVSGNHDGGLSMESLPDNLYVFSQNRTWQSYDLQENITLTGIDANYLDGGKYYDLRLRPERFNIVVLHGDIRRADGEGVSLQALQNKHIDYLALGHIHIPTMTAERLDGRGKYRYCGCLEGRGFDEVGKRGCFLLDIQNGRIVREDFLCFAKREVVEKTADISACATYYDVERSALTALNGVRREDIVKLRLQGNHQAGLKKDIPFLTSRLAQNFFQIKVVDESRLSIDFDSFKNDLSERGEFVREVGRCVMNEEERAEILEVGLKALAGEEIDL